MEQLLSYEQYSVLLKEFKQEYPKCKVNKLFMRKELEAMIFAGKLYFERVGGVLWFLSDEDNYYEAYLYAPEGLPVSVPVLNKDLVVELYGNDLRYDDSLEQVLTNAGFKKYRRYLESSFQIEDIIENVMEKVEVYRKYWGKYGYTCRKATKRDYGVMRHIWEIAENDDDYVFAEMTDAELEEMEQFGRCFLISDAMDEICAFSLYLKKNKICYLYIAGTLKLGLAGWALYEEISSAYEEGCTDGIVWVREDNHRSKGMIENIGTLTGKYYWQFVYKAN